MPIIFVENMICFGGKFSRLTFYDGIKMFIANKEFIYGDQIKTVGTNNICDGFCASKIQNLIFYGVIICNKHSSIINIKKGIIYNDLRKTVRTINTCDSFCTLKIQNIYFLWCYYLRQTFFHHKYKRRY